MKNHFGWYFQMQVGSQIGPKETLTDLKSILQTVYFKNTFTNIVHKNSVWICEILKKYPKSMKKYMKSRGLSFSQVVCTFSKYTFFTWKSKKSTKKHKK